MAKDEAEKSLEGAVIPCPYSQEKVKCILIFVSAIYSLHVRLLLGLIYSPRHRKILRERKRKR